jgi:fumarate hydratase subunit beta
MSAVKKLTTPLTPKAVRDLRKGDAVEITGTIVTGRDALHKLWIKGWPEYPDLTLRGSVLYHCGPVVRKEKDGWSMLAAGPTTSIREEPYEASVIAHYGFAGIIGKGGMGPKTLAALKEYGAVYLHAIGGAAQVLARKIVRVQGVRHLEEIGVPEGMWILEVKDFPCLVTMDSHGESLHEEVKKSSRAIFDELIGKKKAGAA